MRKRIAHLMGGALLALGCEVAAPTTDRYGAVFCSPPELSSVEGVAAKAIVSGRGTFDLVGSEDGASSVEIPEYPSGNVGLRLVFYKGDLPVAETTRSLNLTAEQTVVVRVETCKVEFPDSDGDGISNLDEALIPGLDSAVLGSGSSGLMGKTTWGTASDCTASAKDCFSATVTVAGAARSFSHELSSFDAYWSESSYLGTSGETTGKCGYVRADFETTPDVDGDVYRIYFEANIDQATCPSVGVIKTPGEVRLDRYVAEIRILQTLGVGGIDSVRSGGRMTVKELGSGVGAVFSGSFDVKLPKKSMQGSFRFTRRKDLQ